MLLLMLERRMPIDMVLTADTGMEFPEMYEHLAKLDEHLYRERGIHLTTLRHPKGFEYLMFEEKKQKLSSIENREKLGVSLYGNGWPGVKVRWCTGQLKTHLINKEVNRLKGAYQALHYVDTLSKGIKYNKNDVVIEFFKDADCTDKIATWAENSGKFTVGYDDTANTMTIRMTDTGLAEINEAATVYADSVKRGYSDCTMRISYAATLTADAKMGDTDNPNEVVLTWKRTNTTYFDTLKDCCHVYTYGIDVLKQFSDNGGNLRNVKFRLHNDTDDVFVVAEQKDGVYYAKGFAAKKADATTFVPNAQGHIVVKGLEDDAYSLTEIATDKGYVLLREAVKIVIKTAESGQCEKCGAKLLTASATVNGKDVTMTDGNAIVPLTVVNNPGFDLPKTGGYGVWMYTVGGVLLLGAAAFIVIRSRKHKDEQ